MVLSKAKIGDYEQILVHIHDGGSGAPPEARLEGSASVPKPE